MCLKIRWDELKFFEWETGPKQKRSCIIHLITWAGLPRDQIQIGPKTLLRSE